MCIHTKFLTYGTYIFCCGHPWYLTKIKFWINPFKRQKGNTTSEVVINSEELENQGKTPWGSNTIASSAQESIFFPRRAVPFKVGKDLSSQKLRLTHLNRRKSQPTSASLYELLTNIARERRQHWKGLKTANSHHVFIAWNPSERREKQAKSG